MSRYQNRRKLYPSQVRRARARRREFIINCLGWTACGLLASPIVAVLIIGAALNLAGCGGNVVCHF